MPQCYTLVLPDQLRRTNTKVPAWNVPPDVPLKDAREAVALGIPVYVDLLRETRLKVRMEAAHVLSVFTDHFDELWPILTDALAREVTDDRRTNLIHALGDLAGARWEQSPYFEAIFNSPKNDRQQFAAALAIARTANANTPDTVAHYLASVVLDDFPEVSRPNLQPDLEIACGGFRGVWHFMFCVNWDSSAWTSSFSRL